jgi:hypothetical protein
VLPGVGENFIAFFEHQPVVDDVHRVGAVVTDKYLVDVRADESGHELPSGGDIGKLAAEGTRIG